MQIFKHCNHNLVFTWRDTEIQTIHFRASRYCSFNLFLFPLTNTKLQILQSYFRCLNRCSWRNARCRKLHQRSPRWCWWRWRCSPPRQCARVCVRGGGEQRRDIELPQHHVLHPQSGLRLPQRLGSKVRQTGRHVWGWPGGGRRLKTQCVCVCCCRNMIKIIVTDLQ